MERGKRDGWKCRLCVVGACPVRYVRCIVRICVGAGKWCSLCCVCDVLLCVLSAGMSCLYCACRGSFTCAACLVRGWWCACVYCVVLCWGVVCAWVGGILCCVHISLSCVV